MFNFDVKISNGKLVSSMEINDVKYCVVWDYESVVSIVTPNGHDGSHEFYYF